MPTSQEARAQIANPKHPIPKLYPERELKFARTEVNNVLADFSLRQQQRARNKLR